MINSKYDMSVIKKTKSNFAVVPREAMERNDISLKAKGLLAYLLCMPDNWQVYVSQLSEVMKEGRDAISGAINELREAGYIVRTAIKDELGKFAGYDYSVYDYPVNGKPVNGKPVNGKPVNGKPVNGKPATNNKDFKKQDLKKQEIDIERGRENSENAFDNAVNVNRKAATELPNVQAPFESDKNKSLWSDWQEHLRQKGKAPSRVTLEAHAKELRYHDEATANAMIVQAIAKGWLSIYPLDKKQEAKQPAPPQFKEAPKTNSLPPGAFTIT